MLTQCVGHLDAAVDKWLGLEGRLPVNWDKRPKVVTGMDVARMDDSARASSFNLEVGRAVGTVSRRPPLEAPHVLQPELNAELPYTLRRRAARLSVDEAQSLKTGRERAWIASVHR